MNLKMALGLVFSLLIAQTSQAVQIVCMGSYAGLYKFRASGELNSTHTRIRGNIALQVIGGGQTRNFTLIPTSSDIREGSYIRGTGRTTDGTGTGELSANFDEGSGSYPGTLHAQDGERNVTVNVTCGFYQSLN